MYDRTIIGTSAFGCIVGLYIGQRALWSRISLSYPPGPPGLPWFGNITGVNTDAPWLTYAQWAKTYGDLVYCRLLGKDIIIINSEKVAKDLLEVRARNYSDRPYLITNDLCGLNFNSISMTYSDRWRLHRRLFHQTFRLDAVQRFLPYQQRRACHLLCRLLDAPEQLDDHLFEYTAAIVMNSTYDYDPMSRKDELVDMAASALNTIRDVLRPDVAFVLGAFPWVLQLPLWFPGMSLIREMAVAREYSKQYLEQPFEYALHKARDGVLAPSMIYDALRGMEEKGISPEQAWMDDLKGASGTAFLAASDTSNAVLMTFFLMMVLNPGAQEKAQAQIDSLLGTTRLPTLDDRPLLPFIDAIFWETLRYCPVLPLSIPHAAVDEDVYRGYRIPKGALLMANLWSMAHDESKYPDPHAFIPERFLNDDGSLKPNDTEHIAFGFGRRICAGRHFADVTVWMVIAKVLAIFKILKPVDENGVEILVEPKFSSGIAIHPLPFKYRILPRFQEMDVEQLEKLISMSYA